MVTLARSAQTHKALAHPVRLRILAMLAGGELCVCQMTAVLSLAPSTVSAHLAELKRAELIAERKDGRWVRYRWHDTRQTQRLVKQIVAGVAADGRIEEDARLLTEVRRLPLERVCEAQMKLARLGIRVRTPRQISRRERGRGRQ
jgi:arsenate reductase/ArsR family transcriptional regulator